MQKQTIIKEATTLAQAGRERVYVHFHIEQRVPVHFHIEQNFTGKFISNQYVSASASAPAGASASASVSVPYQHPHSVLAINFFIFQTDDIVLYCTILNSWVENYGSSYKSTCGGTIQEKSI